MTSGLHLAHCTHAAALYACQTWHYSGSVPPGPLVRIGVWEDGQYIGCVLFARGASPHLLSQYGLTTIEGCELVRVALNKHDTPVTRIVAIAIRLLKQSNPGLRLIVSFADPVQGHVGGIYQGGGWIYTGTSAPAKAYRDHTGRVWHQRMVTASGQTKVFGRTKKVLSPADCTAIILPGKHRYLYPLDREMQAKIQPLSRPYPKKDRVGGAQVDTHAVQAGEGGAIPTPTLQTSTEAA